MLRKAIFVALAIPAVAVALIVYAYLKPPAEASGPIQAIPIQQATTTAATNTPVPQGTTASQPAATPLPTAPAPILFEIDQSGSQARFVVDEVLRGSPNTVVGSTNQVAGQILIDPAQRTAKVGDIQIDARTLATDDAQRNRAIQNRILFTDQNEYITFTPTSLKGLPDTASVGQTYAFKVEGSLKIRNTSRPVTFDVTVTPTSNTRLSGSAKATIKYADWGISIPQVPFVANVSDQVRLELDFVATAR